MSFEQHLREDRRLVILQLLSQANGYDLSATILKTALQSFGHRPSTDQLNGELAWLEEQGLVTTTQAGSTVVAKLTARGEDAAKGSASVPGVKRPGPEA